MLDLVPLVHFTKVHWAADFRPDNLSDASVFASSHDMWTRHRSSWTVLLHVFLG